jgi:hypothetical protein
MAADLIPLADTIAALREQLAAAVKGGEGQEIRFQVGPVQLTFNVVVQREGEADGKISFKVLGWGVEGGASGKISDQHTQTITITLTPKLPGGGELLTADTP